MQGHAAQIFFKAETLLNNAFIKAQLHVLLLYFCSWSSCRVKDDKFESGMSLSCTLFQYAIFLSVIGIIGVLNIHEEMLN